MNNLRVFSRLRSWLLILVVLGLIPALRGATFTVTTNADAGPGSLRQSLLDAATNAGADTITFSPTLSGATILLTNGELVLNKNLFIDASALPGGLQLNGNGSRIFVLAGGYTVVLNSLAMRGHAFEGGAIFNSGALTLNHCTISGCRAQVGGGILNEGSLTLNSSTVSGNFANSGIGGILNRGTILLNYSIVSGNVADSVGGGIDNIGTLTMNGSTVSSNTSGNFGQGRRI